MDICGEGKAPGKSDLLTLAEKSGLDGKTCREVLDQILEVARRFKIEAKNQPIRKTTVAEIDDAIQANIGRFV